MATGTSLDISAQAGFHRRGRAGALNDLLRVAGELLVPAVQAAQVDFAIATDRTSTFSYTGGDAKLYTYETTIVQQWARYLSSHSAFRDYGVVWEAAFRTYRQGRPPAVDVVVEDSRSTATERVALFEMKISEKTLDKEAIKKDAKKLDSLKASPSRLSQSSAVVAKKFVVNIVVDLDPSTSALSFETSVKALAKKWKAKPAIVPIFSAVFPIFRPSSSSSGSPMWILHGMAMYEVK